MNKIKLTVFTAAVFLFSTGTSARPIRPPFPAPFPSFDTTSVNTSVPVSIADDFTPVQSGLLSNVSFVGSWEYNNMDEFKAIHIGIMDDIDGKPGKEFWGTYVEDIIITPSEKKRPPFHWYFDPLSEKFHPNKAKLFQVDLPLNNGCVLKEGEKYWLSITAFPADPEKNHLGWITLPVKDFDGGNAVWSKFKQEEWQGLKIPPIGSQPDMDFSIKITSDVPEPTALWLLAVGSILIILRVKFSANQAYRV